MPRHMTHIPHVQLATFSFLLIWSTVFYFLVDNRRKSLYLSRLFNLKASRAASPRRNEGVTGNDNPGCLSSSSSEIEYEDDDEDDPSRQLEVIGKLKGASGFVGGFFIEGEAGPCSSRRTGRADKVCDEA